MTLDLTSLKVRKQWRIVRKQNHQEKWSMLEFYTHQTIKYKGRIMIVGRSLQLCQHFNCPEAVILWRSPGRLHWETTRRGPETVQNADSPQGFRCLPFPCSLKATSVRGPRPQMPSWAFTLVSQKPGDSKWVLWHNASVLSRFVTQQYQLEELLRNFTIYEL